MQNECDFDQKRKADIMFTPAIQNSESWFAGCTDMNKHEKFKHL